MAIITISRGSLSGGRTLAGCLGANLGYKVVSREELVQESARRYGVDEKSLQKGLEEAPRFWDRFRVDRRIYVSVAQATLCHLVRTDDVVYHGHAGHLLLRGVGHVLRVRIIMPMNQRIPLAVQEHGLAEGAAEGFIRMWRLERACQIQLAAQAGGALIEPSAQMCRQSQALGEEFLTDQGPLGELEFAALVRVIEAEDPGYRS